MKTSGLRLSRLAATVAVAVAFAAALLSTPAVARAQERVPLGGGSGLVVNGETLCTLTTIGTDSRGKLIGFTSAHCGAGSPGRRRERPGGRGTGHDGGGQ